MDNKDNKRGFSGLSDLTSDTGTLPQSQPRQTSPQPSAPQKPVFALLELTKWPTLPAPWSSVDAGETRLNLGDYEGDTNPQVVKRRFFEILGRQLGVSGQPKMIGDLTQAHEHPETGMPAQKEKL